MRRMFLGLVGVLFLMGCPEPEPEGVDAGAMPPPDCCVDADVTPESPCEPGPEPTLVFGRLSGANFTAFPEGGDLIIENRAQAGTVTTVDVRLTGVGEQATSLNVTLHSDAPDGADIGSVQLDASPLQCNPVAGRFWTGIVFSTFPGNGETVYLEGSGTFEGPDGPVDVSGQIALTAKYQ
jgi:hypothetical protein